jgi:signal transduction histidine kinase
VGFEEDGAVLFERFRRSTIVQTQDQPGTGLGLAIVRAVAEAHGGRVRARSEGRGRGSIFEVALPLSTAASLSQEHDEA